MQDSKGTLAAAIDVRGDHAMKSHNRCEADPRVDLSLNAIRSATPSTDNTVQALVYLPAIAPAARAASRDSGVPASFLVADALIASNYGARGLRAYPGTVSAGLPFMNADSSDDCKRRFFAAHSKLLATRYPTALPTRDVETFVRSIQRLDSERTVVPYFRTEEEAEEFIRVAVACQLDGWGSSRASRSVRAAQC